MKTSIEGITYAVQDWAGLTPHSIHFFLALIIQGLREYQRNLEVLVGVTGNLDIDGICGITSASYTGLAETVFCNPNPMVGRYVTIRTTEAVPLVIGWVQVTFVEH